MHLQSIFAEDFKGRDHFGHEITLSNSHFQLWIEIIRFELRGCISIFLSKFCQEVITDKAFEYLEVSIDGNSSKRRVEDNKV